MPSYRHDWRDSQRRRSHRNDAVEGRAKSSSRKPLGDVTKKYRTNKQSSYKNDKDMSVIQISKAERHDMEHSGNGHDDPLETTVASSGYLSQPLDQFSTHSTQEAISGFTFFDDIFSQTNYSDDTALQSTFGTQKYSSSRAKSELYDDSSPKKYIQKKPYSEPSSSSDYVNEYVRKHQIQVTQERSQKLVRRSQSTTQRSSQSASRKSRTQKPVTNSAGISIGSQVNQASSQRRLPRASQISSQRPRTQSTFTELYQHLRKNNVDDSAYLIDNYEYCRYIEASFRPRPSYMSKQPEIKPTMRTILIEWLVEVSQALSRDFIFSNDVLPLTVNILDRFLTLMGVRKDKLQLLGMVSFMLASKVLDTIPPDISCLVGMMNHTYTHSHVRKMETCLIQALQFNIYGSVPSDFYNLYLLHSKARPDIDQTGIDPRQISSRSLSAIFVQFLMELSLTNYDLSVVAPLSQTALCAVLLLRTLIYVLRCRSLGSKTRSRTMCERYCTVYVSVQKQEPDLVYDVQKKGIITRALRDFVNDYGAKSTKNLMLELLNEWQILNIENDKTPYPIYSKYCHPDYNACFPSLIWLICEGNRQISPQDIERIF